MNATRQSRLSDAARQLQLDLTLAQNATLLAYVELLERWNKVYNLTAVRDPEQMLSLHVLDCLAAVPPLRRQMASHPNPRILDAGSGGGLPGVVIAALNPTCTVTCVDSVGKKIAFIRQVAAELKLPNLHAEHCRVEKLVAKPFDIVTSRAFASLADFVGATRNHLAPGGLWLAMKGKRPDGEIEQLPAEVTVFHVEPLQVPGLDAERCLVWLQLKP